MLNIQYRMHPSISKFPNEKFYDGKIIDRPNIKDYNNNYLHGHMYGPYSFIHIEDGFEENINRVQKILLKMLWWPILLADLLKVCLTFELIIKNM